MYSSRINGQAVSEASSAPVALSPARLGLVFCCILAAGLDVRFKEISGGRGPASNLLELLMVVIFLFALADSAVNRYHVSSVLGAAWRSNRFVVLYAVWAMFASLVGVAYYPLSLFVFRNLLPAFLFFAMATYAFRRNSDFFWALVVFVIAAAPNMVLGMSQLILGKPYPIPLNLASSVKMDVDGTFVKIAVSGLFNHPNALSVYLLPVFLVALGLLFSRIRMSFWIRLGLFLGACAAAGLLFATKAKGSWLWVAFGMFVLLWPRAVIKSRYGASLMGLAVVGLITAAVVGSLVHGGSLSTMLTRVLLWKSAMVTMLSEPFVAVFGSGQEAVWFASARISDLQYANAHNVFLNQAVYFGIPAAILYVACFAYAVHAAHQSYRNSDDVTVRTVAHVCMAVLCAMAGQYFFEPAAESSGLAVEAFLFMALAGSLWRRRA